MNKDYMNDEIELTNSEEAWFHGPRVRDEFQTQLRNELRRQLMQNNSTSVQNRFGKLRSLFTRNTRTGQTHLHLLRSLVPVLVALMLISGISYVVAGYLGYIPGFGMVNSDSGFKVLSAPEEQVKDGIQLRVESVIADLTSTSVIYSLKGIPPSLYAHSVVTDQFARICRDNVWLELADGERLDLLEAGSLGYNSDNAYQKTAFFGPLPKDNTKATFHMDCIEDTYPGWGPENWAIPFSMETATDLASFPVLTAQTTPANDVNNSFTITNLIPVKDGFIVLGYYTPPNDEIRIQSIYLPDISFLDVNGNSLPYRTSTDFPLPKSTENLPIAYFVEADKDSFPLTLQANRISYPCGGKNPLRLDLASLPPANQRIIVDETIDMYECSLRLVTIINDGKNILLRLESDGHKVDGLQVSIAGKHRNLPYMFSDDAVIVTLDILGNNTNKYIDLNISSVQLIPLELPREIIDLDDFN